MKEAMKYATTIARFNRVELPEDFSINLLTSEKEGQMDSYANAIRKVLTIITKKKVIRRRAICMPYIWFVEGIFLLVRK